MTSLKPVCAVAVNVAEVKPARDTVDWTYQVTVVDDGVGDGVGAPVTAVEAAMVAAATEAGWLAVVRVNATVRDARFAAWFALAFVRPVATVTVQGTLAGALFVATVKTTLAPAWPWDARTAVNADWEVYVVVPPQVVAVPQPLEVPTVAVRAPLVPLMLGRTRVILLVVATRKLAVKPYETEVAVL
jgi:hypothetical protein